MAPRNRIEYSYHFQKKNDDGNEEGIAEGIEEIIKEFPYLFITVHKERKLQFEHLHYLSTFVADTDIVCFLDDDDTFVSDKISTTHFIMKDKELDFISYSNYERKEYDEFNQIIFHKYPKNNRFIEFWRMTMYGALLKDWFNNTQNYCILSFSEIIDHFQGYVDVVFSGSLKSKCKLHINNILYTKNSYDIKPDYHKEKRNNKNANDIFDRIIGGHFDILQFEKLLKDY